MTTITVTIETNPIITVLPADEREHRVIEFTARTEHDETIRVAGAIAHDQTNTIHAGDTIVLIGAQHGNRFDFTGLFAHTLGTTAKTPLRSWLDTHLAEPAIDPAAADLERRRTAASVMRLSDAHAAADAAGLTIATDTPGVDLNFNGKDLEKVEISLDLLSKLLDFELSRPMPTA